MKTAFRLLVLNVVPVLWLLLVLESASQNLRAQPLHWLALSVAIAFAYATLSFTLALGRRRVSRVALALSLLALAASAACDALERTPDTDVLTSFLLGSMYLVWLAAFGAAAVSQWFLPRVPWRLTGYIGVAVVHVLMIGPLVLVLVAFFGTMAAGG